MAKLKFSISILFVILVCYLQANESYAFRRISGDLIKESKAGYSQKLYTIQINELMASNTNGKKDEFDENDDWFEIYNYGDQTIDLNGLYFTDDIANPMKWQLLSSNGKIKPGDYQIFWADGQPEQGAFHTNFKLSADGEYLGIYHSDSSLICEMYFDEQKTDVSFGCISDLKDSLRYIDRATPGKTNYYKGVMGWLPEPLASSKSGFFDEPFKIKLESPVEGATIRYSLDNSELSENSLVYKKPIKIERTTILKAALFKKGYQKGNSLCLSFINEKNDFSNPVLLLNAPTHDLNGLDGIFRNPGDNIEVVGSFDYFEDNQLVYSSNTGIKFHAPEDQTEQHSMRLYARSEYGNKWFKYPFFANRAPKKFKRLVLRNGGNDNIMNDVNGLQFRDYAVQRIALRSNRNPNISEAQPVNLFLNGKYYGVYNIRERIDEYYIETRKGLTNEVDVLERCFLEPGNKYAIHGSFSEYDKDVDFVVNHPDLNQKGVYDSIQVLFDLENYMDYWITEVFAGNNDWLSNNIKFWGNIENRWQWIYWDVDFSLGSNEGLSADPDWNTLEWSLGMKDRAGSKGENNRLMRKLLTNDQFKKEFIHRAIFLLNTHFCYPQTKKVIDSLYTIYRPDMPRSLKKWGNALENWDASFSIVYDFLEKRPAAVLNHFKDYFNLGSFVTINVQVEPPYAGAVYLDAVRITENLFTGNFLPKNQSLLTTEPHSGFELEQFEFANGTPFDGTFNLSSDTTIIVRFRDTMNSRDLRISEISYNNDYEFSPTDWLELVNTGSKELVLDHYELEIDGNRFKFPQNQKLKTGEYLIIAQNKKLFQAIFTGNINVLEWPKLEISSSTEVTLKSHSNVIDQVQCSAFNAIWKDGFTHGLKSFLLPNLPNNWELSENHLGTPAKENHSEFTFSLPVGRDTTYHFNNAKKATNLHNWLSYYDDDKHKFAGIEFIRTTNENAIFINKKKVEKNKLYPAAEIKVDPNKLNVFDDVIYRLVDASGSKSESIRIRIFKN